LNGRSSPMKDRSSVGYSTTRSKTSTR
jgi:hypothetical protein